MDDKIDDAVHAAMRALGLSVDANIEIAERLNDALTAILGGNP